MATKKLNAPRVSPPETPDDLDTGHTLTAGGFHDERLWTTLTERTDASRSQVSSCVIRDVRADAIVLDHAGITDLLIQDVHLAQLSLRGARARRVAIRSGRIGTLDLADADIDELTVDDARVDYLALGRATLTDAVITGVGFGSVDAPAARLTRVAFVHSTADELDLRESKNTDLDLRGLDIAHHLDVRGLAGATISPVQAVTIAAQAASALGARVQD